MTDEELKRVTVCFTGHRALAQSSQNEIVSRLDVVIDRCAEKGFTRFLSGGALGFDTLAAHRVIAAKERHLDLKLILILPCRDQTKLWKSLPDINEYRYLKEVSDEIVYIQDFYDGGCMKKRNRYMVDHSSLCIAYYNGRPGGTGYTLKYAKETGVALLNIFKSE